LHGLDELVAVAGADDVLLGGGDGGGGHDGRGGEGVDLHGDIIDLQKGV